MCVQWSAVESIFAANLHIVFTCVNTKGSSSTFVCVKLCLTCVIKMGSFCAFACFILYKKELPIINGSCHKYHFCSDKCFVMTNTCLL